MSPDRLNKLTILVVEDHDDARRYLGLFLGHLGANVLLASDAYKALDAVKSHHPNLVISDISMPGRDGFGLLQDIRALGPEDGGNVPVVAMTALIRAADRDLMIAAGFQACLAKPFGPDKLVETILSVLDGTSSESTAD
jgi:CheY-like chemotaxis protein